MSVRGAGRGRGRGRPRGPKTIIWTWEAYKPGPEVYNALFRLHKAPPRITHALPNDCPIAGARSQIIDRRQTNDEFRHNYYVVRITYLSSESRGSREASEEFEDVDVSRILKYVSPRELERYENSIFREEAAEEAVALRAEQEELQHRRLEKNARTPGIGRGSRSLNGLGLDSEVQLRPRLRGRPRGRPRGRGRGRGRGLPGYRLLEDVESKDNIMTEPLESLETLNREDEDLQRIIAESEMGEEESDEARPMKHPSPILARSSFFVNSGFPHVVPNTDESDPEDSDIQSGVKEHLIAWQHNHERQNLETDVQNEGKYRHGTKRRRTNSTTSPRSSAFSASPTSKQLLSRAHISSIQRDTELLKSTFEESTGEASEDDDIPAKIIPLQTHQKQVHRRQDYQDQDEEGKVGDGGSDTEEYVVEAILDHFEQGGNNYYLVKWQDYDGSDWLHEEDLDGAVTLVSEYNQKVRRTKGKRTIR